jgi:O-antigen/teichoic acid export membrane protein
MARRHVLRSGALLAGGNAISSLAAFLRNVLLARLISVADFGIASLAGMVVATIETISNLAVDRLLVQAPDGEDETLQATAHAFQVARGATFAVLLFFCAGPIARLFNVPHTVWAFQVLALVPLIRGLAHLDAVRFQRSMNFAPSVWMEVVPQCLALLLTWPLAWWTGNYSAAVWLILIQTAIGTLMSHRVAQRSYRWRWDGPSVRRLTEFGWPLLANGLLMFVIFQGDKAVVGTNFSMEVLGFYSAAFGLGLAPALLLTKVCQSLFLPPLARCQADEPRFAERYAVTVQFCILLGLIVGIGFAALGPEVLVLLFGEPYRSGGAVAVWLGLMQAIRIAKAGPMIVAMAKGDTKVPLLANFPRVGGLAIAILVAVSGGRIEAVAATALAGEAVSAALSFHLLKSRLGLLLGLFARPFIAVLIAESLVLLAAIHARNEGLTLLPWGIALVAIPLGSSLVLACSPELRREFVRVLRV